MAPGLSPLLGLAQGVHVVSWAMVNQMGLQRSLGAFPEVSPLDIGFISMKL